MIETRFSLWARTGKTRALKRLPPAHSSRPGSRFSRRIVSKISRARCFSTTSASTFSSPTHMAKPAMLASCGSGKWNAPSSCAPVWLTNVSTTVVRAIWSRTSTVTWWTPTDSATARPSTWATSEPSDSLTDAPFRLLSQTGSAATRASLSPVRR